MNDEKFFWGTASASYQVEGGIENCDWAEGARLGKVPKCGDSVDHYHRFEEDFDIARGLGTNAHRFSVEWSRIEPEEGVFDEKEIEHYRQVIKVLRERGLEPFVTIWHFTLPIWFTESGGFLRRDAAKVFARYVEYVVSKLGQDVRFWITINEPLVFIDGGYWRGNWPPFQRHQLIKFWRVQRALIRAHRLAYRRIKIISPDSQVGIAKHCLCFEANKNPFNQLKRLFGRWLFNHHFLRSIRHEQDFIGLNYYISKWFGPAPKLPKTDMGWYIYPQGFYKVLRELGRFGRPIYITENGIADADDSRRAAYITDYLSALMRARNEGVIIKGYFYWTLLDNYEWAFGFSKHFGLVAVDRLTQKRTVRSSAATYTALINKYK